MRVAFLGLGIMGRAMCRNAAKAGFAVAACNRTPREAGDLLAVGVRLVASPAEAAHDADVVVVMVTGPEATDAVLFGEDGAGSNLPGKTVISMSTVPPEYACDLGKRLEALGARFVDAPVSGSQKPAEEGNLVILAGGEEADIGAVTPLFRALGKKVVHCGGVGQGSLMKMTVNLLLGVMMEGLCEALTLGEAGGLTRAQMLDVVQAGPLGNGLFVMKRDLLVNDVFAPQFPLKHMAKDLGYVAVAADGLDVAAPNARTTLALYRKALADGLGENDFSAIVRTLSRER